MSPKCFSEDQFDRLVFCKCHALHAHTLLATLCSLLDALPQMLSRPNSSADGDAGVLVGYGAVQTFMDATLAPVASTNPELFALAQPIPGASLQGIVLAALWVGITSVQNGYRAGATRTLPSKESLIPLATAWLGSGTILLTLCAVQGIPLDAEVEFILGSATVVGGWRLLYSDSLPLY